MKLSIVIPVYNEIFTIREILRRVQAVPLDKEIVIVDDGSTDGTRRVLAGITDPNTRVILHEKNGGKGAAICTAAKAITGDAVVIQDADLEYNPAELPALLGFLERDEADVVYGSRFLGTRRSFMFTHYIGNKVLNLITNVLFNVCLTDMETCYKMMRADAFRRLNLQSRGFELEPEITAKVILSGYRLVETPISFVGRDYAEGKKIRWTDGIWAIWALVYWRLFGPDRDEVTLDRLESAHRYNAWVASWIASDVGQRVLEVGAGLGSVAKFFVNREALHLVDVDSRFIERLKNKFRYVDNVTCHQMDFADTSVVEKLSGTPLDTVLLSNVLEHFEDDSRVIENARALLPAGGKLVLVLPAHQELFGTLDVSVGHFRRYEHRGITDLLAKHGFTVKRHSYHNWLGALGWFLSGRVLRQKEITATSIRSFELLMSLARLLDRWLPLSYGQSLAVVAEKNA